MEDPVTPVQNPVVPMQHRLAKMLVGSAAAFLATMVAEKAYDKLLTMKNTSTPDITTE